MKNYTEVDEEIIREMIEENGGMGEDADNRWRKYVTKEYVNWSVVMDYMPWRDKDSDANFLMEDEWTIPINTLIKINPERLVLDFYDILDPRNRAAIGRINELTNIKVLEIYVEGKYIANKRISLGFISGLKTLRELYVRHLVSRRRDRIRYEDVWMISKLPNLHTLAGIRPEREMGEMPGIKRLYWKYWHGETEDRISERLDRCQDVEHLHIDGWTPHEYIKLNYGKIKSSKKLRVLILRELKVYNVEELIEGTFENLEYVEITNMAEAFDDRSKRVTGHPRETHRILQQFPRLRVGVFSGMGKIEVPKGYEAIEVGDHPVIYIVNKKENVGGCIEKVKDIIKEVIGRDKEYSVTTMAKLEISDDDIINAYSIENGTTKYT